MACREALTKTCAGDIEPYTACAVTQALPAKFHQIFVFSSEKVRDRSSRTRKYQDSKGASEQEVALET